MALFGAFTPTFQPHISTGTTVRRFRFHLLLANNNACSKQIPLDKFEAAEPIEPFEKIRLS